jgi:glutamyl-tRNA reductase
MHQIGVVGLSYRHVGVDEVARFSVPKTEVAARLPVLRDALGVSEVFYVGTCNRVEVLFAMPDGASAGDARRDVFRALIGREPVGNEATRILRAWTGEAAVEHLFLVTCGLDSAQTGEQEIAAQIRLAWEAAREAHVCGPTLDKLLREALSMAHRVHKLEANVRTPSLADLAADRIIRQFDGKPAPVALVGVSPMTKRCGMILHRAGIPLLIVNRTLETAKEYAATVEGRAVQLDAFREAPSEVGALVLAAGGNEPLLDGKSLPKIAAAAGARSPLLLDFGVPPNADPEATKAAGIARVGMDDLIQAAQERRLSQLMRLAPVRAAIDERLNRLRSDLATRAIGRKLADLRTAFEQIAADETERALADELSTLDAAQRELLQRFASTVARRLAHLPLAGMRAAAAHASTDAVDAFFREAKLRRSTNADTSWKANPDAVQPTTHDAPLDDELSVNGGRWQPDPTPAEAVVGGWKPDDLISDATGPRARSEPEASDLRRHGWKPDDSDVTGRQPSVDRAASERQVRGWKPDVEAADAVHPKGTARWPTNGVTRAADASAARQVRRAAESPDAAAVVAHAAPVRTSWAKD